MVRTLLAIAGLMMLWALGNSDKALSKEPTLPEARWPDPVVGAGESAKDAKQDALKEAVKTVKKLMKQSDPPLDSFEVTADYVKEHIVDEGRPGKDFLLPVGNAGGERGPAFKRWILTFRTDHNWYADLVRRDQEAQRKIHAEDRQTLASGGVFGFAILLLAGFGYLRLDEYTHKHYTTWLRVAGIAVLLLVGVGWWCVFFDK